MNHSRFLSYVLRHRPEVIGLHLDPAGWADVGELRQALASHGRVLTRLDLEALVAASDKQRFQLEDGRIRAAQGHSIDVDLHLEPRVPPEILFHGTHPGALDLIAAGGLLPMGRRLVHLSADEQTARTVGARRGRPVVLRVLALAAHESGHPYYRAANGVWLTDRVPSRFLPALPS
ncbi:RNA 2'-phosphotransferase [Kineosporia sp. NBRC 101731]|uniref:RNA 2'-phosphotransferase n=1 Tax=Kineosporia sp. NBRC 101731 TaxID=3032199 RepID=UPI0024A5E488|nr:RNA 2'-phosphotransferase [Kineosporia sp. NBRC 101731]GLY31923.1 putative RNA 2'-phosphotransferase [Kineosporia sp. NBRC 101731]